MERHKHILYAVLNWGLGHATRSIPLITSLLKNGSRLTIASDGLALELLKREFPKANFLELIPLNIVYSTRGQQSFALAKQLVYLQQWYRQEQKLLGSFLEKNLVDEIISDNRPTVKSNKIPSYYLTHQLEVRAGLFTPLSTLGHELLFKDYAEIWVPDVAGESNLSGDLSHKSKLKNLKFIGPLSDLKVTTGKPKFDVALILSGPEPQRSLFEKAAIENLADSNLKVLLLRGCTAAPQIEIPQEWQSIDLANRADVQNAFEKSGVIIARSGYSTLMDLYSFNKPAILVPTPGQPEQEYLASLALHQRNFAIQKQGNLNLIEGIEQAQKKFERFENINV